MKKCAAAVIAAAAVLALTALSGVALAGDHHGKDHQKPESAQGVKPSDDTFKDQTCTTGGGQGSSAGCQSGTYPGKQDASKRYGNGDTAAQIANGKGAPAGTPIYGPGNSQPHKICGRDVHAYKGGDCEQQQEQKPPKEQQDQEQQVTFCDMESATSGKLETKDASEVANHEFDGSAEENRDIVPPFTLNGKTYSENWPSGEAIFNAGCNVTPPPVTTTTQATTAVKACEDETAESNDDQGESKDDHGKGDDEHRKAGDVHGKSDDDQAKSDDDQARSDDDECQGTESTTTAMTTTTAPVTTTTTVETTTTVPTTTTAPTTTTTENSAAIAPSATPPASAVLGASKALKAPAATPSHAKGAVLGTLKTLGSTATSGTLPFTGLRLWIVELIALGLIGSGVAMRLIARRRTN